MKITKIVIKNILGIKERELNGDSIEIAGKKGTGKTSVLDAIKYGLTNSSNREMIIRQGSDEGEILIETDNNVLINRKKRENKTDYKLVKKDNLKVQNPEGFLKEIFTELQLNPIEFSKMTTQEQNRAILDLIEFEWDLEWINEQFGEIPKGVDYNQNILNVLNEIQHEKGNYFLQRQDIQRDIRHKKQFIEDISKDIPENYNYNKWKDYNVAGLYENLNKYKEENNLIQRARDFKETYNEKVRAFEVERDLAISGFENQINSEKHSMLEEIARLEELIRGYKEKIAGLEPKLQDKKSIAEAEFKEKVAKLNSQMGEASTYARRSFNEVSYIEEQIKTAESMRTHLNEYERMVDMQRKVQDLLDAADFLTEKIEKARNLPATILKQCTLPIKDLTIENGKPLIKGLPISNLSTGETIELCVDIAVAKSNSLKLILLDGMESISTEERNQLYEICKKKGLQFIATRTTDTELEVTNLEG